MAVGLVRMLAPSGKNMIPDV